MQKTALYNFCIDCSMLWETKMEKRCISCGMPLACEEDYPLKDTSKEYCRYCAREDGSMKSFIVSNC